MSLTVQQGAVVALLGPNGAGKSTALKAVCGLLPLENGRITTGSITFNGKELTHWDAAGIVRAGITQAMEGGRVFGHLTVEENLIAGAYTRHDRKWRTESEMVYTLFPRLRQRRNVRSGYLSGGEQQMLAIGRALMSEPQLLLLDEPTLGLAPLPAGMLFRTIADLRSEQALTILIAEQNTQLALATADYGYVIDNGRTILSGPTTELRHSPDLQRLCLGLSTSEQRPNHREQQPSRDSSGSV
ncbi:ABC transporter ATP-binding protein [Streptomyces sp. NPDC005534]|uniref:ABC transporter ATP-binding protein n=1 Tax=Streptomyces sp. NPDC005534 TaxID=3155714 RepID=UPI0034558CAD